MKLSRDKLTFMGLVALDEGAELHRLGGNDPRPFSLRTTLAMLFAFSDGNKEGFVQFWRGCGMAIDETDPQTANRSRIMRSNELTIGFNRILTALGWNPTIALTDDIYRARRPPRPNEPPLRRHTKEEILRHRFAQILREQVKEREDWKEWKRRKQHCTLRG